MYKLIIPKIFLTVLSILLTGSYFKIDSNIIYVNQKSRDDGDGRSWQAAYNNLQDALYNAVKGNELWVAAGTYIPTSKIGGSSERHKSFQIKNGVALYGGFAGIEESREQRNWQKNKTILSGDINGNDQGFIKNTENSYHVVTGNNTDSTAVLDGFIISGGNANAESWPDDGGGGMSNFEGSPTIRNCTFRGNSAFADGGGMRNWGDSRPRIYNCTFVQNTVIQEGGGMMNGPESSPTVANCIFMNNSAGEDGGGIYINESNPLVVNCLFRDNVADLTGGGMYTVNGSRPRIINCTFNRNRALNAGGGLSNLRGNPVLTNCILWTDSAATDPEIHNDTSHPKITYSTITGGYSGRGNLDTDPLFADKALRLSAGSPCIDAGDNSAIPNSVTTDLDEKPRIYNGIVDMGAYEFGK
jgi:predicted outer membrane repeat protein